MQKNTKIWDLYLLLINHRILWNICYDKGSKSQNVIFSSERDYAKC